MSVYPKVSLILFSGFIVQGAWAIGQEQMTPQSTPQPPEAASKEVAQVVEKGELSKKLENKVYLSSGMGLSSVSGSKGDWNAGFAGNFGVAYLFDENFAGMGKGFASFRYTPTDVTVIDKPQSYTGVVEMYQFGLLVHMPMGEFTAVGSAEFALLDISLSSADDNSKEDESLEEGSVNLTVGGGADWKFGEKVTLGPRIHLGFGGVTYWYLGGEAGFYF